MRHTRLLAASIVLLAGCADLKDLAVVSHAIESRYHTPAVVFLGSRSHLVVTLRNAPPALTADSAQQVAFAREVARLAKHTYPHPEALADVSVRFAAVRSSGPVTRTRVNAPPKWTSAELP